MVHRFIILTKEVTIKNKNHSPKADERAIIKGDKYRFTILTDRMIRIEYNENGRPDKGTVLLY